MIFRHKEALFIASILIIATSNAQTNSRSYNTDDWVPVARPNSQNAENQEPVQKRPTGRVLNLPSSDEKRLYLPEQNPTPYRIPVNQQRPKEIRPDSNQQFVQSQRPFPQQPNKYQHVQQPQAEFLPQPQQQILLPPQLESLISQGPSYLTPQRINSQLLPEPQSYQPTIQTLPTQAFSLNGTEFNSRDVVQNINLGLYNQQQVRPTTHKHNHHNDNPEPEVQLLYVPLENLQRQRGQRQQIPYPTEQTHQIYQQPPPQQYHHATHKQVQHNLEQDYIPHQIQTQKPSAHKQVQLHNIEQDYVQQALQAQKLQEQFQHVPIAQPPPQLLKSYRQPYFQEEVTKAPTTLAPTQATKKRKPHQPPLAVYMGTEGHDEIKVGDVLSLLKEAKTISVQDSVGPDSPQVFVGPSHLEPPEGYVKFDLPYLSSIEGNRVERKVDQLPFFVAPLSYKTPPGYSKIPFPAPHVGSVVINHLKASPSPQTSTTEHIRFVPTQTTEDNRYYNQETSTQRIRTRQRQPTRGSYTASTTVKSIVDEIPYGPLPTKVVENQNLNPYGPTKFVQSSTPPTYDQSSLPEQIFSTRNRFSTPAPTAYSQNIPSRHNKYLPHSTESTPTSTTLSASLSNDKYTVLEEFSIKPNQQDSHQKHQTRFRPTQDTYTDESGDKTSLPLLSNPQILNDEIQNSFRPSFTYKNPQAQYEPTQEVPTKHRIVEHYNIQSEQPVTQTSPVYEFVKESHKQQQQYVPEYYQPQNIDKAPVRHSNVHYSSQDSSTQRTRGKQHFQPEYQDEYDQQSILTKPTESVISVTKEPVIEYQTPEIQSHHLTGVRDQAHVSENYYHVQQEPQKQDYVLPAELPPISPQLPGLINSLQDQQRPLLAPLLLPPSEQTPHVSSETPLELEYYSAEPSTSTTTTTTTTPIPITETTTQFKRTRSRQRGTRPTTSHDYSYTTPAPRRAPTNYRTRRPASQNTNTQQRQEFASRTKEKENYPSSTIHSDIDTTTRATFTRNRHVSRDRQPYVSSTTEQPRRSPAPTVTSSRQRFRTRGRPAKSEEDYLERSTPEIEPAFHQPQLEGGFQAAVPVLQQQVELTLPNENIQRESATLKTQKEQALIYIQNKPTAQEASSIQQVTSEEIINRPNYVSSTEALEPLYHSTIAASAPENNIVHDQPTLLVNPSVSPQQYSPTQTAKIDHHNREHSHFKYRDDEEDIKDPSTTEFTRQRTRIRTKTRARTNPVTTSRYQQQQTSTNPTNHRSSSESSQEDQEEEFYGFFRPPNFQKPVQVDYKANSDLISTPRSSPTVAYVRQPTENAQNVYVSLDNSPIYSTPRSYSPVTHDTYANPNIQTQYVSSTLSPPSISSEDNVDIQPVTRRPVSNNYRRRPNTPVRGDVSVSTEKYYSRTSKRPETNSPQGSRVRGRTRRPTSRPTTDADAYSHSPRTNELENHSEEYREPTKSRTRTISRGKSHFQGPTHKQSSTEDLENDNYPAAFLQGQSIQPTRNYGNIPAGSSQQSVVSADAITPRSTFQLTIEPEEVYDDQVPNYSIKKTNVASSSKDLEEGGEESKFSAKVVEKPSNFNFIVSEEKGVEKTKEDQKENNELTTTPSTVLTESSEEVEKTSTVENIEEVTTQSSDVSTTETPTTTEDFTDKPKNRRRGVWKLKKIRPLNEEFESAESQNVGTVFDNQFDVNEKPLRRYKVVHRLRTTTEPLHPETTTVVFPETTSVIAETEKIVADVSTTEASVFEPLYEMFGFKSEHEEPQLASNDELTTTTESSNLYNTFVDEVETTTFINNNTTTALPEETNDDSPPATPRIIGTSTTTEISHETEICYRGRCVKSTSTENIERV